MAKDKTYQRLINTARWRRLRRDVLTRHPLCVRCLQEGRVRMATEVHHKRPVEEGFSDTEKEQLMYDPHNLVPLCHDCHVRTHTEMGRCGKAAAKERNRRQLEMLIKKFIQNGDDDGVKK